MKLSANIIKGLALTLLLSCQSTPTKKIAPIEYVDILEDFQKLPKATQTTALENGWIYFTYAFQYSKFQQKLLKEFPSLNVFPSKPALLGKTPLDLRLLYKTDINPLALLLAIDLEMEILSRFHTNTQTSPKCLEDFWSEWGLPLPRTHISSKMDYTPRNLSQSSTLESVKEVPLNEKSKRLSIYLLQSLGMSPDTKIKLLSFEEPIRAQFLVNDNESYEIFSSPIECKALQEKKFLIPLLGKMKCLQKQSATWITVSAKESTVVSDNWVSEVKQRCQKWERPISDQLNKEQLQIKNTPLSKAWSLYPRLRNFVLSEADRYEASFRKAL